MNIFKKLFRRRKNTINLSAEEAYASENAHEAAKRHAIDASEPSSPAKDRLSEAPGDAASAAAADEAVRSEKSAAPEPIPEPEAQPSFAEQSGAVFLSVQDPDSVKERLRLFLRDKAKGFQEDASSFSAIMDDSASLRLRLKQLQPGDMDLSSSIPQEAQERLKEALDIIASFNVRMNVNVKAPEGYDITRILTALAEEFQACYTLNEETLLRWDGVLILNPEGETQIAPQESKREEDSPADEASVTDEGDASCGQGETDADKDAQDPDLKTAPEETPFQKRQKQIEEEMMKHGIPLDYSVSARLEPSAIHLPSRDDMIRRACSLMFVSYAARQAGAKAEGTAITRINRALERLDAAYDLRAALTPKEDAMIHQPTSARAEMLKSRTEASATVLWALGLFELGWPSSPCDTEALENLFASSSLHALAREAVPREPDELLYQYELTTRLHSACLNLSAAQLKDLELDQDVIYERHYALNWLLGVSGRKAWDDIIPST